MTMFADRFEMTKLLGHGGMAEVWLAQQRGMSGFSRPVVIKKMLKGFCEDNEFVRRFEDEARVAALINHPNVVRVEDFGEEQGVPYLVMEFIEGRDLAVASEQVNGLGRRLPQRLVIQIGVDIARGLHEVHGQHDLSGRHLGIVHRDVSPQNIMLDRDGRSRLLDFGVARAATNRVKTQVGILKGKIAYFSPEQSRGDTLDGASDQYALGVVLFELLTGHRLFLDRSDLSTLRRVRRAIVPDLRDYCDPIGDDLVEVMGQVLHREKDQRFADCGAMAAHLERCLDRMGGRIEGEELSQLLDELDAATAKSLPSCPLPDISDERTQVSLSGIRKIASRDPGEALTVVSQPGFLAEFAEESTATSEEVEFETLRDLPDIEGTLEEDEPVRRIHVPEPQFTGAEVLAPVLAPEYTQNSSFGGPKFTLLLVIGIGLVAGLLFTFM